MPPRILRFEDTPNPAAVKCILDRPVGEPISAPASTNAPTAAPPPRSFRTPAAARADPLASALFAIPGVTSILIAGDWITINKSPDSDWKHIKAAVKKTLANT